MDLPILKHLDTLIGLAVVMLIVSTVVVAINQFALSCWNRRSRYLRETLTDLVSSIAPGLSQTQAVYTAERILRHPLVGRRRWLNGWRGTGWQGIGPFPLPKVARGEVILRHEIVSALLEWSGGEGPMALQDRELLAEYAAARESIPELLRVLKAGLAECGIADPRQAARDMRGNYLESERANPAQPSQVWQTQALASSGLGDLSGRVFAWYDNSMERVTEFFSLEAKVVASVIALVLCFVIQLDAVDLLRRLSQDEKLRAALVAKAEMAKIDYERSTSTTERTEAEKVVRESLAALRDPKASAIPDYLVWDRIAQLRVGRWVERPKPGAKLRVRLDQRDEGKEVAIGDLCLTGRDFPRCVAAAIRRADAPVEVYEDRDGFTVVARKQDVAVVSLWILPDQTEVPGTPSRGGDSAGFWHRFPGVMLSWVLVSLGAPFWYDLLKRLLRFRSILQPKDEAERETRRSQQTDASTVNNPATLGTSPSALQGKPTGVVLDRETSLRAEPKLSAAITGTLPSGYLLNVEGFVDGEPVRVGASGNAKWYRTLQGSFVWAGDTKGDD